MYNIFYKQLKDKLIFIFNLKNRAYIKKKLSNLLKTYLWIFFNKPASKTISKKGKFKDYIIFGVIPWNFRRQRPQHIALILSKKGHRVFYVSPSFMRCGRSGFIANIIDKNGLLFEINLNSKLAGVIYDSVPDNNVIRQLLDSVGKLLVLSRSRLAVIIVQHPYWCNIAEQIPSLKIIYDCMDHHGGFNNTSQSIIDLEKNIIKLSDLTIVSSDYLYRYASKYTDKCHIIRNGCDFEHFSSLNINIYKDKINRKIIGYYGAIAEWFDCDLIKEISIRFKDCCILLIGDDTANAKSKLSKYNNVLFVGEVSYDKLPYYLNGFDVCLLPFKITPLTLATNPVKIYEYLCSGKPIVTVDLPEMGQFSDFIFVARTYDEFTDAIDNAINFDEPIEIINKRKNFAREQSWENRVSLIRDYAEEISIEQRISIIIVTYNNINLTVNCLKSIDEFSFYGNIEIIVVDNASTDGSIEYLKEWVLVCKNRKVILNSENKGFSAANNQGLEIATGEFFVLLNNDTYVTPGWLMTLVKHLRRDKSIGLIGPVTNNIGNEAKINLSYENMTQMLEKSEHYTRRNLGKTFPIRTVAFFCVMMRSSVYKKIGPLDEVFGRGFFEDDDYCRRVESFGFHIVCAQDVFVHHELSASFSKLKKQERNELFKKNKDIYEKKWGKWVPHRHK